MSQSRRPDRNAKVSLFSAILIVGALSRAASASDLEALLKGPITAGSVGLLIKFADDPRVEGALRQALDDPNPEVRRAAARAIAAGHVARLAGPALERLEREPDGEAAIELIRAVAFNRGPEVDDQLIVRAAALGPLVTGPTGHVLAWARSERALEYWPLLRTAYSARSAAEFLRIATREGSGLAKMGTDAIRTRNGDLWRSIVSADDGATSQLDAGMLREAFTVSAEFRSILLWSTVARRAWGAARESHDVRLRQWLALARETAAASPTSPDAAFAMTVLARRLGAPVKDDEEAIKALVGAEPLPLDEYLPELETVPLSPREAAALEARALRLGFTWTPKSGSRRRSEPEVSSPTVALRTPAGFPNGFVEAVLKAAGCRPLDRKIMIAGVGYDTLGRVLSVEFAPMSVPEACLDAFDALVRGSLQQDARLVSRAEQLMLPMHKESLACLARSEPSGPIATIGEASRPTLVHEEKPVYPAASVSARVQGDVMLEATISSAGCVKGLNLLGTVDPSLNTSAIVAISKWRFSPARRDGFPVPVVVTVSVGFRFER